ncbi:hypothetical protein SAMN05444396_11180 [Flavobacterium segetis]|uniref:Uncharacterized protein n=1 Tax=Flavobacterium segetis TaxID=271157 RepID=A0A1M5JL48_9FLAO|nr:hypothetical protein [Flavobacterium segetis]SHG41294.1 hypothetical protein SAMN05444396_11180 [Flavobacterium segetis]
MEDQNTKIANLQVKISENCTEKEKQIIELYWEFNKIEVINSPKHVKNTFNIRFAELNKIIGTYSEVSFFLFCEHCQSYEFQKMSSVTKYKEITKLHRHGNSHLNFKCFHCQSIEENQAIIEKHKAHKKLMQKLNQAIETKNWNNLNHFEREILSNCLEINFTQLKKKYGGQLGKESFIKLIRALDNIANENLLHLLRGGWNNYIYDYQYVTRLTEFKDEIKVPEKPTPNGAKIDVDTNELKFKLTINDRQHHPDSPEHAGTVTFKERIVIEPGVVYIFGLWNRANDNLYLTMTPLENLEKTPITKRINSHPISLQEGIADFLNRLGKDF